MKRKNCAILVLLLGAAVMMTGCQGKVNSVPSAVAPAAEVSAATSAASAPETAQAPASQAPSVSEAAGSDVVLLTYQEAVGLVMNEYSDALPLMCSFDYEGGTPVWEVEVLSQDGLVYEAEVDAKSGTILKSHPSDDRAEVEPGEVQIGYVQAVDTALAAHTGSSFESFALERGAAGQIIYEIELRDAAHLEIDTAVNAQTGELITYGSSGSSSYSQAGSHHSEHGYGHDDYDDYDDVHAYHD